MIIKAETMAEMVRAYAIKVNAHKSVEVVADISTWAYHYILNWYNEKGVINEDWSDLAVCDERIGSEVVVARNELYKKAMRAYGRASV